MPHALPIHVAAMPPISPGRLAETLITPSGAALAADGARASCRP